MNCPKSELSRWRTEQQAQRDMKLQHVTEALINELYPEVGSLNDKQRADLLLFAKSNAKDLPNLASSANVESNWGQFRNSPGLVLGIMQLCKFVEVGEQIENGIETNVRYGAKYTERKGFEFLEKHTGIKKLIKYNGYLHLGLSTIWTIDSIIALQNSEDGIHTFNGSLLLTQRLGDLASDFAERGNELNFISSKETGLFARWNKSNLVKKYDILRPSELLGKLAVGFSIVEGVAENWANARSLVDSEATLELKILSTFSAFFGSTGNIIRTAVDAKILQNIGNGAKALTPGLGTTMVAGEILKLSKLPLDIYSIAMQREYADQLSALHEEYKKHNYHGYNLLSDFYKEKAILDTVYTAIDTTISVIDIGIANALRLSVIGLPASIAVSMVMATISMISDVSKQQIIEKMARDQHTKIEAWKLANPGKNYFEQALDANYGMNKGTIAELAKGLERSWDVDQVILLTQVMSNAQMRELYMLVQSKDELPSGKLFIDIFKDGASLKQKGIHLDVKKGIIDNTNDDLRQLFTLTSSRPIPENQKIKKVTVKVPSVWETILNGLKIAGLHMAKAEARGYAQFDVEDYHVLYKEEEREESLFGSVPILAPGEEKIENVFDGYERPAIIMSPSGTPPPHVQQPTAKYKKQRLVNPVDWTINDKGTDSTKFNLDNMVQRVRMRDGSIKKISIHLNMGAGNDLVVAPIGGSLNADGGVGYDVASYVNSDSPVKATVKDGKYAVKKGLKKTKVLEEFIAKQSGHFGMRSEEAEYRAVEWKEVTENIVDTFVNIEKLIGSKANDEFILEEDWDIDVDGGDGNDQITLGALNDKNGKNIVRGGAGSDDIRTRGGHDIILQDIIKNAGYDSICGGDGIDTIYYNTTAPTTDTTHGIVVDLQNVENGTVNKHIKRNTNSQLSYEHVGTDTVKHVENIAATDGDDWIKMSDEHNIVHTLAGKDTVETYAGHDRIYNGIGPKTIHAGDDDDAIYMSIDQNASTIDGGAGTNDTLNYHEMTDFKSGHRNEGTWHMGTTGVRADLKNGKVIKFSHTTNGVSNLENEERASLVTSSTDIYDTIKNIENIETTDLDDSILGSDKANNITTYAGNDQIHARGGDDEIIVGAGNKIIHGGAGDDMVKVTSADGGNTIDGGTGFDSVDYSGIDLKLERWIEVNLLEGYAKKYTKKIDGTITFTQDKLTNIERVIGTQHHDILCGDHEDNLLAAGLGNDTYVFKKGNGHDIIQDEGGDSDTIEIKSAILLDQYSLNKEGNDLVFQSNDGKDSITIFNNFLNKNSKIEHLKLADGTVYQVDKLIQKASYSPGGTSKSWSFSLQKLVQEVNMIKGTNADIKGDASFNNIVDYTGPSSDAEREVIINLLTGYAKKYHIQKDGKKAHTSYQLENTKGAIGTNYDDEFRGDDSDNFFDGGEGKNTFNGGKGNDYFRGGHDKDIYMYGLKAVSNHGHDTIEDAGGADDKIHFMAKLDGYSLQKKGNDLIVVKETNNSVKVLNHFLNDNNKMEYLAFDSNSYQVDSLTNKATLLAGAGTDWSYQVQVLL